jgi:hypothetical protein
MSAIRVLLRNSIDYAGLFPPAALDMDTAVDNYRRYRAGDAIRDTMHLIPDSLQAYLEIPIDRDPSSLIAAIGRSGARAKVRTGGVTHDGFPPTAHLLRFLQACVRAGVAFKATAGLHHAMRAEYHLTYEPDSPTGSMFGFLNLFLAGAFLRAGMAEREAAQILEEESPLAFQFDNRGVSWRDHRIGLDALGATREDVIVSFGSCSFTEPLEELQALSLLEPRVQQA